MLLIMIIANTILCDLIIQGNNMQHRQKLVEIPLTEEDLRAELKIRQARKKILRQQRREPLMAVFNLMLALLLPDFTEWLFLQPVTTIVWIKISAYLLNHAPYAFNFTIHRFLEKQTYALLANKKFIKEGLPQLDETLMNVLCKKYINTMTIGGRLPCLTMIESLPNNHFLLHVLNSPRINIRDNLMKFMAFAPLLPSSALGHYKKHALRSVDMRLLIGEMIAIYDYTINQSDNDAVVDYFHYIGITGFITLTSWMLELAGSRLIFQPLMKLYFHRWDKGFDNEVCLDDMLTLEKLREKVCRLRNESQHEETVAFLSISISIAATAIGLWWLGYRNPMESVVTILLMTLFQLSDLLNESYRKLNLTRNLSRIKDDLDFISGQNKYFEVRLNHKTSFSHSSFTLLAKKYFDVPAKTVCEILKEVLSLNEINEFYAGYQQVTLPASLSMTKKMTKHIANQFISFIEIERKNIDFLKKVKIMAKQFLTDDTIFVVRQRENGTGNTLFRIRFPTSTRCHKLSELDNLHKVLDKCTLHTESLPNFIDFLADSSSSINMLLLEELATEYKEKSATHSTLYPLTNKTLLSQENDAMKKAGLRQRRYLPVKEEKESKEEKEDVNTPAHVVRWNSAYHDYCYNPQHPDPISPIVPLQAPGSKNHYVRFNIKSEEFEKRGVKDLYKFFRETVNSGKISKHANEQGNTLISPGETLMKEVLNPQPGEARWQPVSLVTKRLGKGGNIRLFAVPIINAHKDILHDVRCADFRAH